MTKSNKEKLKKIGMLTEFNQFVKDYKDTKSTLKRGDKIIVFQEPNRPCVYQRGWTGSVIDPDPREQYPDGNWICVDWLKTGGKDLTHYDGWYIERKCVRRIP